MIIAIRDNSDIPIYLQLKNQIVQGISSGQLAPGEQLPTVRALADEMGINAMTVNKAYQLLKQEGYIYTERRNGARVRENLSLSKEFSQDSKESLRQIISEAKLRGYAFDEFVDICREIYEKQSK